MEVTEVATTEIEIFKYTWWRFLKYNKSGYKLNIDSLISYLASNSIKRCLQIFLEFNFYVYGGCPKCPLSWLGQKVTLFHLRGTLSNLRDNIDRRLRQPKGRIMHLKAGIMLAWGHGCNDNILIPEILIFIVLWLSTWGQWRYCFSLSPGSQPEDNTLFPKCRLNKPIVPCSSTANNPNCFNC